MVSFLKLPQRIQDKVEIEPNSGCWIWTGRVQKGRGYPVFDFYNPLNQKNRPVRVNRLLYEMYVAGIDDGLELDHLCRTPLCVNPKHLEAVSHAENMRRHQATVSPKTHCIRGHEYAVVGFYLVNGSHGVERRCKECQRIKNARRYQ
jgi:hypothetical protein